MRLVNELAKFNKSERKAQTDLDKLLYTMKTVDKPTKTIPDFWQETWLSGAVRQSDTRPMSPDERASYAIA